MKSEIIKQWRCLGRDLLIVKNVLQNMTDWYYTVYVQTFSEKDYSYGVVSNLDSPLELVRCHGGITYCGTLTSFIKNVNKRFFGYDYAHVGDDCESLRMEDLVKEAEEFAIRVWAWEQYELRIDELGKRYLFDLQMLLNEVDCLASKKRVGLKTGETIDLYKGNSKK